ncbi:Pc15g00190 [Rhizoctonia solani]|uniref:Pc15g00190 n=1 Tax=Rhizoctonia solani TaxID=456999 RepID=A0A0K6GHM2_9AGAM|nr:Pc15g00190 [Rhizoctonia solani]
MGNTPMTRIPCPYFVGATFSLEITPTEGGPFLAEAKVVHVYAPFTMSSVMRVALTPLRTCATFPGEVVLKVYDRRFADGIREECSIDPPTYEGEALYAEYLHSGDVAQTEDQIYELADSLPEERDHIKLGEHLAAITVKPLFRDEQTTYEALSSLQGRYIPTFYGTTRFLDEPSQAGLDTTVPGILVEFIPGTNLSRVDLTSIELNAVCSTAVDIVNLCSDLNVLNSDVRLENFIVKPNGSEIVMIDFGHCRLRREDEVDQSWKEAKDLWRSLLKVPEVARYEGAGIEGWDGNGRERKREKTRANTSESE